MLHSFLASDDHAPTRSLAVRSLTHVSLSVCLTVISFPGPLDRLLRLHHLFSPDHDSFSAWYKHLLSAAFLAPWPLLVAVGKGGRKRKKREVLRFGAGPRLHADEQLRSLSTFSLRSSFSASGAL